MSDAIQSRSASADPGAASRADVAYDEDRGLGWLVFAGIMLSIVGILNIVYGIAAIDKSTFFAVDAKYVITDLNNWGWFLLIVGAIQFLAAFGIWAGSEWGRWVGIVSAGANAILQMFFIPAFPLLSVTLFAVDILVIYGLVAYGGHRRADA
jgi:hypothetical protein